MEAPSHSLTRELDWWQITLRTGDVVEVRAHGYVEADGFLRFVALMRGAPHYEYELARIPTSVVVAVLGG
jgi:hypothetical protein